MNRFYSSVKIVCVCLHQISCGFFFRIGDIVPIEVCGYFDHIGVSAFVVHLTAAHDKIALHIGNGTIQHFFDEGTQTAVGAVADEDQFRTLAQITAGTLVAVMNDTFAGGFAPATKAADAVADFAFGTDDFIFSFFRKRKIFQIRDDQFHSNISLL